MRGSRVLVAILLSFFVAQSASAATVWLYDRTVQRIQVGGNGDFIMYLPSGTGPTCQESGTIFRFMSGYSGQTAEGVKASLAAVMMALAMNKTVSFAYDDSGCTVSSMLVSR
jgi:uncharacterized protein YjlB